MAMIKKGDALPDYQLQPGWTYNEDAFGLATSSSSYKIDYDSEISDDFTVGEAHPVISYLKAHKYSVKHDNLKISTVTIDYAGIIYEGGYTLPQMTNSNSLGSENITAHPNFVDVAADFTDAIAGDVYNEDSRGPIITRPDKTSGKSYVGLNGSCFERSHEDGGGRFIGFVDPTFREFYGKTNYLTPVTSFAGVIYTEVDEAPAQFLGCLGWASTSANWGGELPLDILPDYVPIPPPGEFGGCLLLSGVNIEQFSGTLKKISYEVRCNTEGWSSKVYRQT